MSKIHSHIEDTEYTLSTKSNRNRTRSVSQRSASRRIGRFVRTHRTKITTTYLAHVCSDQGECMTFGKEFKRITKLFNHFTDFRYESGPLHHLTAPSANGMVLVVPYSRENFHSNALLKISQSRDPNKNTHADNLYYEFMVGCFLNQYASKFPCFLYTYGCYKLSNVLVDQIRDLVIAPSPFPGTTAQVTAPPVVMHEQESQWELVEDAVKLLDRRQPLDAMSTLPDSCTNSNQFAVLIQYFPKAVPLASKSAEYLHGRIHCILYQIYAVLASMASAFTHYDLHANNVMVVQLPPNTYIQYHYIAPNGTTTTFKMDGECKIIDYGRCFFQYSPHEGGMSSRDIWRHLCFISECTARGKTCGRALGYPFASSEGASNYKSAQYRNHTADLRFAKSICTRAATGTSSLFSIDINYLNHKLPEYIRETGYSELPKSYIRVKDSISTVTDLHKFLHERLQSPHVINQINHIYRTHQKLGDLYIHEDGHQDMKWMEERVA
jgi:hypothetical protein